MPQGVTPGVEALKASMSDGSTFSINGRPVRLLHVSENRARLELEWRVSPSTTIHLKVEPPSGDPIVLKSRVVSARVATVKDGKITYSAEVTFDVPASPVAPAARLSTQTGAPAASPVEGPAEAALLPDDTPSVAAARDQAPSSPQATMVHDGLDVTLRVQKLQEELAAGRAELEEERERRRDGEESFQELERRYAQRAETYEGDQLQWQQERTALLTELQAAQTRAADAHAILENERHERVETRDDEKRLWENERMTLLTGLQAAEARAADAHALLEKERHERVETRDGDQRQRESERTTLLTELQAAEARAADAHATLERERQERIEAQESDRREWDEQRTAMSMEAHAAQARAADVQAMLERERQERREAQETSRRQWEDERSGLQTQCQAAEARAADARATLEDAQAALEEARAALEKERQRRVEAHEDDRRQWEHERMALSMELRAADARTDDARAAVDRERDEHAQALATERARFEAVIAELVETTNAQQGEYEALLARMAAIEADAQRLKEQYESERVARQDAWDQARTDWAGVRRSLDSHLDAAEALCVAYNDASRALRAQSDILSTLFDVDRSPAPSPAAESSKPSPSETTD